MSRLSEKRRPGCQFFELHVSLCAAPALSVLSPARRKVLRDMIPDGALNCGCRQWVRHEFIWREKMNAGKIELEQGRYLQILIWMPFLGFSFVSFMGLRDAFHSHVPGVISVLVLFAVFLAFYRSILYSIERVDDEVLLRSGAGATCVKIKSIEKIIVRPGWGSGSALIRLKVDDRKRPYLFFAALSDSRENGCKKLSAEISDLLN